MSNEIPKPHCQVAIEGNPPCINQCDHCREYFKPSGLPAEGGAMFHPDRHKKKANPLPVQEQGWKGAEDPMYAHLQNIKFMKALYGHCKAYVECHQDDNGAILIDHGKWVNELFLNYGTDWQIRRMKFEIIDYLMSQNIGMEFINSFRKWLFEHKFSTNE